MWPAASPGSLVVAMQREVWRWNDEACIRKDLPKSFADGHRRRRGRRLRRLLAAHGWVAEGLGTAQAAEEARDDEDEAVAGQLGLAAGEEAGQAGRVRGHWRRRLLGGCRSSRTFFELRVVELSSMPFVPDQLQARRGRKGGRGREGKGGTSVRAAIGQAHPPTA